MGSDCRDVQGTVRDNILIFYRVLGSSSWPLLKKNHPGIISRPGGGRSPSFAEQGRWGSGTENSRMGGEGGHPGFGEGVVTPTPSCDYPTPLVRDRRGSPLCPSRRMFHAKHTIWDWNAWGVVPCFLQNRGGGGLFAKKENRGKGGGKSFGGHPPVRSLLSSRTLHNYKKNPPAGSRSGVLVIQAGTAVF